MERAGGRGAKGGAGGAGGEGGAGEGGDVVDAAGSPEPGGAPSSNGAGNSAGGAGQGGADQPDDACKNAPEGTFVRFGEVACFSVVCDGEGQPSVVVDPSHEPLVEGDCSLRACAKNGEVIVTSAPLGAGCDVDGGKYCDAEGSCVSCLSAADCEGGALCSQGSCTELVSSCTDQHINGDETDVDCGGSCAPCDVGKDCYEDSDCAGQACNYYAPMRCVDDHCKDQHKDSDETAIDCGGPTCSPCTAYDWCAVDSDCTSGECHDKFFFCLPDHCTNQVLDGSELGLDCGGGNCYGCDLGNVCQLNSDCLSLACDQNTLTCITDHCEDHHHDADETDLDCGGASCQGCPVGKKCTVISDCAAGLNCSGVPQVCY